MASQEEKGHQIELLRINRRTLRLLLNQKAVLQNYTPPYVLAGIEEARFNIDRIKRILAGYGVVVADEDSDFTSPEPPEPPEPPKEAR